MPPQDTQNEIQTRKYTSLEELEQGPGVKRLAELMFEWLKPWNDPLELVERGIRDALAEDGPLRNFVLVGTMDGDEVGAVVMLSTRMGGYIPENLLLFIAVDPDRRGHGIGGRILEESLNACDGDVKLHVEKENPAGRLYERAGFTDKYREMRWEK